MLENPAWGAAATSRWPHVAIFNFHSKCERAMAKNAPVSFAFKNIVSYG